MGSAGYRIEQGEHYAHRDIIRGETKFILRMKGHNVMQKNDKEYRLKGGKNTEPQTSSRYVPFKSLDIKDLGIEPRWNIKSWDDLLAWYKKDFESYGNVFEDFEFYKVSVKNITKTLEETSDIEKIKGKRSVERKRWGRCYCSKCS